MVAAVCGTARRVGAARQPRQPVDVTVMGARTFKDVTRQWPAWDLLCLPKRLRVLVERDPLDPERCSILATVDVLQHRDAAGRLARLEFSAHSPEPAPGEQPWKSVGFGLETELLCERLAASMLGRDGERDDDDVDPAA